ncbi:MAG: insulinase family protein [Acidobacteria bacterium]|nr:insulinase family protein [Acidobacteriota bacterium]
MTKKSQPGSKRTRSIAWEICLGFFLASILIAAVGVAREEPPEVPPPKPLILPTPTVAKLSNGLQVVVVERRALPLLTLRLVVRSGAESDPQQLPGVAQMTAEVLTQGTSRRSAREISDAVDSMGAQLTSGAEWDQSYAELAGLSDQTDRAFELLSDIVRHPAFPAEEVDRKRQQSISALDLLRDDPAYMADAVFNVLVFQGTPYGHPLDGTVETLRRLSRRDLEAFHARYYQPDNCILAVVGDISQGDALARVEKFFGEWKGTAPSSSLPPAGSERIWRRIVVVDKPDAVQTEIRAGNRSVRRDSPQYYALTVANQVLGGPAVNRLFRQLRSRRGLAYGASSELTLQQTAGAWMGKTSTRTSETVRSLRAMLEEIDRLRSGHVSSQEMRMAKSYLVGHMALEFETSDDIAAQTLELIVHRLPLSYWNDFAEQVNRVEPSDVTVSAEEDLNENSQVIVLVGDSSQFSRELRKVGPFETIALKDLDLASPGLLRRGR